MLRHLCAEVEEHEPEALMFCASWCAAAGAFYVVEMCVSPTPACSPLSTVREGAGGRTDY